MSQAVLPPPSTPPTIPTGIGTQAPVSSAPNPMPTFNPGLGGGGGQPPAPSNFSAILARLGQSGTDSMTYGQSEGGVGACSSPPPTPYFPPRGFYRCDKWLWFIHGGWFVMCCPG